MTSIPPDRDVSAVVAMVDLAVQVVVGASVALVARAILGETQLWRSSALWALVLLEVLVYAPFAGYVAYRYPDWRFLYLTDSHTTSKLTRATLIAVPIAMALAAFGYARYLLLRDRIFAVLILCAAALLIALGVGYGLRDALLWVGTTQAFVTSQSSLRPLGQTSLSYLLTGGVTAFGLAWGATLYRLRLVSHAAARAHAADNKAGAKPKSSRTQPPKSTKKK